MAVPTTPPPAGRSKPPAPHASVRMHRCGCSGADAAVPRLLWQHSWDATHKPVCSRNQLHRRRRMPMLSARCCQAPSRFSGVCLPIVRSLSHCAPASPHRPARGGGPHQAGPGQGLCRHRHRCRRPLWLLGGARRPAGSDGHPPCLAVRAWAAGKPANRWQQSKHYWQLGFPRWCAVRRGRAVGWLACATASC